MSLIATLALSAVSTSVRILAALALTKVIAVKAGPETLALVGQFSGLAGIVTAFAGGAITVGVTKYMAEYANDPARQRALLATSIRLTVGTSLVTGAFLVVLNEPLSRLLLNNSEYGPALVLLGISLPLTALNLFLIAVMTGAKELRRVIALNVAGSLLSLAIGVPLVIEFDTFGALAAAGVAPSAGIFVTAAVAFYSPWLHRSNFSAAIDSEIVKRLAGFCVMAMTSVIAVQLSGIVIRAVLTSSVSLEATGYWQGIWQISDGYLLIVATSLSLYYLPRLSEITDPGELRRELTNAARVLIPATISSALIVYLLRETIIILLFSEEFLPMSDLFKFQLLGDVLKISSWLISFLMIARARTTLFIATELIFSATFVVISTLLIPRFGVLGATLAFALNYLLYLSVMVWIFRREIGLVD